MEPIEPGRPSDLQPVAETPVAAPPPKLALRATLLAVAFVLVVSVGAAVAIWTGRRRIGE